MPSERSESRSHVIPSGGRRPESRNRDHTGRGVPLSLTIAIPRLRASGAPLGMTKSYGSSLYQAANARSKKTLLNSTHSPSDGGSE